MSQRPITSRSDSHVTDDRGEKPALLKDEFVTMIPKSRAFAHLRTLWRCQARPGRRDEGPLPRVFIMRQSFQQGCPQCPGSGAPEALGLVAEACTSKTLWEPACRGDADSPGPEAVDAQRQACSLCQSRLVRARLPAPRGRRGQSHGRQPLRVQARHAPPATPRCCPRVPAQRGQGRALPSHAALEEQGLNTRPHSMHGLTLRE